MTANRPDTISPTSFAVAPELLGLPLAGAGRRLVAMLVDLAIIAMLVKIGGVLLGFAAAFALLRASGRWSGRRSFSVLALRFTAAIVLFFSVISIWGFWEKAPALIAARLTGGSAAVDTSRGFSMKEMGASAFEAFELNKAEDSAQARVLADRLVTNLKARGASADQLADVRSELMAESSEGEADAQIGESNDKNLSLNPLASQAFQDAIAAQDSSLLAGRPGARADSVVLAYAAALAAGDTSRADSLRGTLVGRMAGDSIRRLRRQVDQLSDQVETLEKEQGTAGETSVVRTLLGVLDDFGLGVGWMGLYFTAFVALWRGQTPGKRLLGLRVVRLDGKPMSWWAAFERFGGYSASVITGLLGFAQILWDRNRMALHDKITETVVVRVFNGRG
jgi:uncharacterized RDD family membrane protein YckC